MAVFLVLGIYTSWPSLLRLAGCCWSLSMLNKSSTKFSLILLRSLSWFERVVLWEQKRALHSLGTYG